MTRPASQNDFTVEVESLGTFVFARRTGRDRFKIAAEYHRLTEGLDVTDSEFGLVSEALATVKTLLVEGAPEITAMLDLDAPSDCDPDGDAKLLRVFFALRQKELSFRPGAGEGGEASREVDIAKPGVLVSP
jgi:hypothetical protein